ncbi:unnamed protein product [Symbiodinium necroappetens]|uniref:Uncharacterized protein n=1 Tax=Symbiodinium necroappetens TaxID=1628268 RepID=A0A812LW36_9DINO|nr:unnamed protein product [Symbiodinium necroappetens]
MVKFISRLSLSFPSVASGISGGASFQTPSARYDAQAELCTRLFALGEKATCKERRRSLWAVALNKLQEMRSCATPPNEYSLSSAIVAGQQEGQWRVAVNILSGPRNPGLHQHEILSAGVMRASVEAGCWAVAVEILLHTLAQRLHPTERTFNAALAPSGRHNWAQSAGSMLQSAFPFPSVWHTGKCCCSGACACSNAEPPPAQEKATCHDILP